MRGTVKSFRKALREAFDDALKKDESVNPDDLGMDSEEESASRERQQASGYLGLSMVLRTTATINQVRLPRAMKMIKKP